MSIFNNEFRGFIFSNVVSKPGSSARLVIFTTPFFHDNLCRGRKLSYDTIKKCL